MKKLVLISLILILICSLVLPVMAEETVSAGDTVAGGEQTTVPEGSVGGANGIVEWFKLHFGDVVSVVTLIVAAVIAFINKSGLMPMMKSGFASTFKRQDDSTKVLTDATSKAVSVAEDTNTKIEEARAELMKATEAAYESAKQYTELRADLMKQEAANKTQAQMTKEVADMVYAIVLASSAPEYVREKVVKAHEAIVAQNAAIEAGEASAAEV